ncbi:hypothetical protein AbHV_ORF75 [Abalone herpesvirus Victoria/AUS/2009]|uniref:Uncharacterized protein n=1 Tax=Abalone herpesvirus (isolate Abalone/Australia/Victoria/2009) TaxID=1241371 RepID=K4K8K7_ABHV|nr:hypothetical protein AbHV_ORF75 [Abalone herpesvirus Victoria/AUS/2009]AFU90087.1 hypothetical protein AbHV_ORF75 [Abalone herpesvirus Victoria/AUS/2009]UCX57062.1 ORF72 [Haliotid herpesvirus 1]
MMASKIITLKKRNASTHLAKLSNYEIPKGKSLWICDPSEFLYKRSALQADYKLVTYIEDRSFYKSVNRLVNDMETAGKLTVLSPYSPYEVFSLRNRKMGERVCFADVEENINKHFEVVNAIGGQDVDNHLVAPKDVSLSSLFEQLLLRLRAGEIFNPAPTSLVGCVRNVQAFMQQPLSHPQMTNDRREHLIESVKQHEDHESQIGCGTVSLDDAIMIGFDQHGVKVKSEDEIVERLLDLGYGEN